MASVSIFVSHNRNDNAFCAALVDALQKAGADVWYDERNLGPEELRKTIERELRRCPIFLVVLSPDALKSEWVYDECNWAYSLYKQDTERSRIILPVLARSVKKNDIWLFLTDFKRIEEGHCGALPQEEAVQQTLSLLALFSTSDTSTQVFTVVDLLERGAALFAQKRYQEMLSMCEVSVLLDPHSSVAWSSKARALWYLKQYRKALTASEEAIQLNPQNVVGWNYKGNALNVLKQYDKALVAYDQAITLDPTYALPWNNKGNTLSNLGRYKEALAAYDQAITLDPTYARAWNNKGTTLDDLGRYEEALAAYDQAITLDPMYALVWNNRGTTFDDLERYEEALAAYDQAITLDPTYARAWNNKGFSLRALGRIAEAQASEAKAKELGYSS